MKRSGIGTPEAKGPVSKQIRGWPVTLMTVCIISIGAIVGIGKSGHFGTLQRQLQLDWRPWGGPSLNWLASPEAQPLEEAVCQCQSSDGKDPPPGVCAASDSIDGCCCDYGSVERMNGQIADPLLAELVQQPFFRYFKVNLYCDCPFWPDDGMCSLRDCSVCECEEGEVPTPWRDADAIPPPPAMACDGTTESESAVDRTVDPAVKQQLVNIRGWRGFNNPWMPKDDDVDYSYINLLKNPERYTGYKGEHAHRIWNMIYSQSCFKDIDDKDVCPEKRVFYRLISGVHASISAHIADKYLLDEARGVWGPNLPMFQERLGNEGVKDRVENLYFTYLFVLRAIIKAGPLLANVEYNTGMPEQDAHTLDLVKALVDNAALKAACAEPYNEARLWKGDHENVLRKQLQAHFQNITKVMDCVGCEKCKLWGKLQLLGIATSLKILFSADDCGGVPSAEPQLQLERNEVIALFNLMERLSHSVEAIRRLSQMVADGIVSEPVSTHAALGQPVGLSTFLS